MASAQTLNGIDVDQPTAGGEFSVSTERCIGPTGSVDLPETTCVLKQKDRLAAVSPKSDQMFLLDADSAAP